MPENGIIFKKLFIEYQNPKEKMINKTILSIKYYCVAHNLPFADPGFAQVLATPPPFIVKSAHARGASPFTQGV